MIGPDEATPEPAAMPARAWGLALALLAPLGLFAVTLDPGLLTGERLLGAGTADLWGHAWGYGWVARSLAEGTFPYAEAPLSFPEGQPWWVVDLPVAVVLSPLTWLGGPALAWHGSLALRLGLAAASLGWFLRRRGLSPAVAAAGALVLTWGPVPRGLVLSCVPESLSILLAPAFGQLVLDGLRGSRRAALGAALGGALLVLDGGYTGLAAAGCGGIAAGVALREAGSLRGGLLRALGAALVGAPAAIATLVQRHLVAATGHRALSRSPMEITVTEDWPAVIPGSSDLLVAVAHAWMLPEVREEVVHRHVAYLGLPLLLGALLVAIRGRGSRSFLALGLLAGLISLGGRLSVGGEVLAQLPGAVLAALGGGNTYRLAALAAVALVTALLLGLPARWRLPVLGLVFLDGLFAAPPSPGTVARPEGAVEEALAGGTGGVLDLPLDRDGQGRTGPHPQRAFYLQAVHGRPVASSLHRDNEAVRALRTVKLLEASVGSAILTDGRAKVGLRLRAHNDRAKARDLEALWRLGFRDLSYDGERVPDSAEPEVRAFLLGWLGEPYVQEGARMAWRIPAPDGAGEAADTLKD